MRVLPFCPGLRPGLTETALQAERLHGDVLRDEQPVRRDHPMLQRHKIPTIFNIYMLDVICCALGCVILLWQVSHQEAALQTAAAKDAHADAVQQSINLKTARKKFEQAQSDLLAASSDASQWRDKYQKLSILFELTQRELEDSRKLAAMRQQSLDKSRAALALSDEQLK